MKDFPKPVGRLKKRSFESLVFDANLTQGFSMLTTPGEKLHLVLSS